MARRFHLMEIQKKIYARVLTIVIAGLLVLGAFVGLINGLSGSADAGVSTATIEPAELIHTVPASGNAVLTESVIEELPQIELAIPGELILAAFTDTTPHEWVEGFGNKLWREPTPEPVATPAPVVEPTDVPVEESKPLLDSEHGEEHVIEGVVTYNEPEVALVAPEPVAVQTDGWAALRNCESGGNYAINTGNSFYGAYQFTIGTWNAVADIIDPTWVGTRPDLATAAVQDQMAYALRHTIAWGGWQHWPVCGRFIA
jgi:hypothetical protein